MVSCFGFSFSCLVFWFRFRWFQFDLCRFRFVDAACRPACPPCLLVWRLLTSLFADSSVFLKADVAIVFAVRQGADLVRRTYDEWCDYLLYIPGALDGKLSIIRPELREDVAAMVQLLLVLVLCVRGRKPYTQEEGRKLWQDGFLAMYRHVDSIAGTIHEARQAGGSDSDSDENESDRFNDVVAELARYELAMDDQGYFDTAGEGEEAKVASRAGRRGICLGEHAVGPTDVGAKHKAHLIQQ